MKKLKKLLLALIAILSFVFASSANAETILVDPSMSSNEIESKVVDESVIVFAEGTYEDIHFNLKNVTVTFIANGNVSFIGDGTVGKEGSVNNGMDLSNSNITFKGGKFKFSNYQNAFNVLAGNLTSITVDGNIVEITGLANLNKTVHEGNAIFCQSRSDFRLDVINGAYFNIHDNPGAALAFYNYSDTRVNVSSNSILDMNDNGYQGIYAHETSYFELNINDNSMVNANGNSRGLTSQVNSYIYMNDNSTLNANDNKVIGINNFYIITYDSVINGNKNTYHGITNVALDSYNSTITTNDNGYRGLNISGIYNENDFGGSTILNNSVVTAQNNGQSGIYFLNSKGTIITNNTIITTSGNGAKTSDKNTFATNGIVGSYNVRIDNSTINTEDKHAFATSETSTSASIWYIYENVIFTAQGLTEIDPDIVDDYNSKHLPGGDDPFVGTVVIDGGSLDASDEVTVSEYEKYKETNKREDVTDTISMINHEGEDLFRFDIDTNNTEVKKSFDNQLYFEYNTKTNDIITYKFMYDINGKAYVWTPLSIVKYHPTEGYVSDLGSSSLYDGYGLNADITIYSNNLLLAQRSIASANRDGYIFTGWYYFLNQDAANLAETYAKEQRWEDLYSLINMSGTKFTEMTKINTEYVTVYAMWEEIGKGGDVEILPPQTGINESTNTSLFNIFNSLVLLLMLLVKKYI